jgi:dihydrofolate reductase
MIAAIAAVSANGMVGRDNWLPWDIPEELAYFERTVEGAALVMGRHTYEGNAAIDYLPPDTFVVSRQAGLALRAGCTAVPDVESAIRGALATGKDVFVIGGASIYAAAWPYCERFYLTRIEREFPGDTLLSASIPFAQWRVVSDVRRTYRERSTDSDVVCRFLQYEQPAPSRLP